MRRALPTAPISDGEITLRLAAERDVAALTAACQDPEIPRWTLVPSPYTEANARMHVRRAAEEAAAGRALHLLAFAARGPGRGALLGSIGLVDVQCDRGVGEIGYWVAREARRRGIAVRGVTLLRDFAVDELGLQTLEILPHSKNAASIAVAERAGFTRTDEIRPAPRAVRPGEPDHLVYVWRASSSA